MLLVAGAVVACYPDAALADAKQALREARDIGQAVNLLFALLHTSLTHIQCRNYAVANEEADELAALTNEKCSSFSKALGMSKMTQIIRVSSAEIRAVFTTWLATQIGVGVRLVILEGLSGVGKSWLTREPFISDGWAAETIEVDHFRKDPVGSKSYVSAIDRAALEAAIDAALVSLLAIVIVEGPIVWPFARSAVTKIGPECVRRVYLKRMMKPNPDVWVDEGFEQRKHPEEYFQSIIRYHANKPWLAADVILERVESDADA